MEAADPTSGICYRPQPSAAVWNNRRRHSHTCSPGRLLMTYGYCSSGITEKNREITSERLFECFPSDSDLPVGHVVCTRLQRNSRNRLVLLPNVGKMFLASLERSSAELRVRGVAEQTNAIMQLYTHMLSLQCPPPSLKCYIQVISIKADLCGGSCNNTAALCFPRPD